MQPAMKKSVKKLKSLRAAFQTAAVEKDACRAGLGAPFRTFSLLAQKAIISLETNKKADAVVQLNRLDALCFAKPYSRKVKKILKTLS